MEIREYRKAASLKEAWELNQKKNNRISGGMMWLRLSRRPAGTLIDLSGLGFDRIVETEDAFHIGAMVTLRQLEQHEGLLKYSSGSVKDAVCHIVGTQFRNMATIGGSVAGRFGFSDVLTWLMVMDCEVALYKGAVSEKEKTDRKKKEEDGGVIFRVPIEKFAEDGPGRDIVIGVIIHKTPAVYCYQSVRMSSTDFPILTLAAARFLPEGKKEDKDDHGKAWRFAVGARPYRAVLVEDTEGLLKSAERKTKAKDKDGAAALPEESILAFVDRLRKRARTGSNMRGSAVYRTHLAGVLAERAIRKLADEETGNETKEQVKGKTADNAGKEAPTC